MSFSNHVVIGGGGAISQALVPELLRNKQEVTLVSRSGMEIAGTTGVSADATNLDALRAAVLPGSVVYLLLGLPYDARVWQELWPTIMTNTIQVCREKESLLVFFDNVYMYGAVDGPMTEETPYRPTSKKGEVRARIAEELQNAWESGGVQGFIARSADFYGPGAETNGIPNMLIIERLLQGKRAQCLGRMDKPHSYTYTSDCGRALYLLVGDEGARNQVWHLPTASPPPTNREFLDLVASELGVPPKHTLLGPLSMKLGSLFDRTIKEVGEMLYQNLEAYIFDSTKFQERYDFVPTSYAQGVRETINYYRQKLPDGVGG